MKHIDFYKKKEKIHNQMIEAISRRMDAHMVDEINVKDLGINGGYACYAAFGPAQECQIEKLKHDIGTNNLSFEITDEWGNERHADLNDDVLNASFDTVYDAVYDLFYSKNCKEERKRLFSKTK